MKKIMIWLLTMIVILSASVTAFAEESNPDGEKTINRHRRICPVY